MRRCGGARCRPVHVGDVTRCDDAALLERRLGACRARARAGQQVAALMEDIEPRRSQADASIAMHAMSTGSARAHRASAVASVTRPRGA